MPSSLISTEDGREVVDVWACGLQSALHNIDQTIKKGYTHIAIDTEFPGTLYKQRYEDRSAVVIYEIMRSNVDKLKPIQIGLSLTDANGQRPVGTSTWQFNMRFDVKSDRYEPKSLQMLEDAKIPLNALTERGIDHEDFKEAFKRSLMYNNSELRWLSFHGCYDFAYLFKAVTGDKMPSSLQGFNNLRKGICPILYDVKMLIQSNQSIMGYSLSKLAQVFEIPESGTFHQAGTDARVTAELYFRVKDYLLGNKIKKFENKLFGLSKVFSINSAEFDSRAKKKSLIERLNGVRTSRRRTQELESRINNKSAPMGYGVVYVSSYGNGYHNPNGKLATLTIGNERRTRN